MQSLQRRCRWFVGCIQGLVYLWVTIYPGVVRAEDPKPLREFRGSWDYPQNLLLSRDGTRLITVGGKQGFYNSNVFETVIDVWDVNTGKSIRKIAVRGHVPRVSISGDGGLIAVREYLPAQPGKVVVYNTKTGKPQFTQDTYFAGKASAMALSPDGKSLVLAASDIPSGMQRVDAVVAIFDLKSKKQTHTFGGVPRMDGNSFRLFPLVNGLAISPENKKLAVVSNVASSGMQLAVYDIESKAEVIPRINFSSTPRWLDEQRLVTDSSISSGAEEARLVEIPSGQAAFGGLVKVVYPEMAGLLAAKKQFSFEQRWQPEAAIFGVWANDGNHLLASYDAPINSRLSISKSNDLVYRESVFVYRRSDNKRFFLHYEKPVVKPYHPFGEISPDGQFFVLSNRPGVIDLYQTKDLSDAPPADLPNPPGDGDAAYKLYEKKNIMGVGIKGKLQGKEIRLQVLSGGGDTGYLSGRIYISSASGGTVYSPDFDGRILKDGTVFWGTGLQGDPYDHIARGTYKDGQLDLQIMVREATGKYTDIGRIKI